MPDLENRAPRKRIRLPGHFTFPVLVEHVSVFDATALVRDPRTAEPNYLHAFEVGAVGEMASLGGRPLRAEPAPDMQKDERTAEQRSIDTLLASFQDITRTAVPGPLVGAPEREHEV